MSQEINETATAPEHPFIRLLTEHQDKISRAVGLMVGDPELANDIAQEAFYTAWQKFDQLDNEAKFISWTYRIAKNIYNHAYRNKKQEQQNLRDFYDSQKSHVLHIAKSQNPANAAQLNDEVEAVQRKIETLPEELRVAFGLHCRDGFSAETIASMLDVSTSTVRKRIAKARQRFTDRNEYMAIAFLTTSTTLAPFQEMIRQFRRLALETGSVGDLLATANSGTPETAAAGATAAGSLITRILWAVFSLPLLTILWVISLLLSGQVCGMTFVRNAPSTQARRWLVKQLLICYGGMICLPALTLVLNGYLVKAWGWDNKDIISTTLFIMIGLLITSYMIWAKQQYLKVCENPTVIIIDQKGLQRFIRRGYWVLSLVVAGVISLALCFFVIPELLTEVEPQHASQSTFIVLIVSGVILSLVLFHVNAWYCFRYFLRISKEEYSNPNSTTQKHQSSWLYEGICVLPFMLFILVPKINHLLIFQTRIITSILEFFIFFTWWVWVFRHNMKFPRQKWYYIIGVFIAQLLIIAFLRSCVYTE